MTQVFLAMMWRGADGSLTIAFWWAAVLSTTGISAGIWSLVAPESMRFHYFRALNWRRSDRGLRLLTPGDAWGWSSQLQIRLSGVLVIVLSIAFMTWIVFFTVPGVAY
jgi:hypothetical protein